MRIAALVVGQRPLRDRLHGLDADPSALGARVADGGFERVQRDPRVARAVGRQRIERFCVHGRRIGRQTSQAAIGVVQRSKQERLDILVLQRFELEHSRAAEQRGHDLERRILRRRADQRDRAVLDRVQHGVLLGLVETVDLVDEQHRPRQPVAASGFGGGDHLA